VVDGQQIPIAIGEIFSDNGRWGHEASLAESNGRGEE
jgi:hypothetical protein